MANEGDENYIAPVLNESELPSLCSDPPPQKKDFPIALKQASETQLSTKCLSRSWFNRKGQEWSHEGDENNIAPVLNESELPSLCSDPPPQKKDFPITLKQASETQISTKCLSRSWFDRKGQEWSHEGDENNIAPVLNESELSPLCPELPPQKKDFPIILKQASETQLSTKYLSRSWFNRKGQEWSNEGNKHYTAPLYISLPMISRKLYNSTGKDKSLDNLKDQNNKNVTNQNPSDKNTNVKLELKAVSKKWYSKRGRLAAKNWGRSSAKENQQVGKSNMTVIKQSATTGSIDENIENIFEQLSRTTSRKRNSELTGLLAVGKLIKSSCVTSTQEAGKVYITARCGEGSKKMTSSYLFDYFGRYFNIVQFYLYDRSYIIENRDQKFDVVIRQLQNITADLDTSCNKKIEGKVGAIFASAIQMMDTKRDKDILKGIFSHATSVKFVSKMQQVQNKTAIMNCRDELKANITTFQEIQKTSQVVRNDMRNSQQSRLQKRIVQRRKDNEMKSRFERRGRMLKCEEWPELAQTLEYIFSEFDQKEKSGGGLEAHARLKNNNMYRCKDNNTFMRQALEIVNSISPPSFNISLSSCFNYTMTYKRNTASAKCHHHGKDVNANISLHNPPKTQVKNLVVNLHYSTANVNYICDDSDLNKKNVIVDSKDAKKIVCAEICPVQKPGKTWFEIEYPDHDWDQSRTNAVTPMTHLFMNTIITERESILPNPA